jgi:hypothetical protein
MWILSGENPKRNGVFGLQPGHSPSDAQTIAEAGGWRQRGIGTLSAYSE